jgi:hypothetical protein
MTSFVSFFNKKSSQNISKEKVREQDRQYKQSVAMNRFIPV